MFVQRTDNKHHVEKRFSDMTREEQEIAAENLLTRARAAIGKQKIIEGQAEEGGENPSRS